MRLAEREDIPAIQQIMEECVKAGGVPPESVQDIGKIIENGACILVDESMRGCLVLIPLDVTSVEAHVAVKPAHRGHDALEMVGETASMIFRQSSIENIYTRFADSDKHVKAFVRWLGMHPIGEGVWKLSVERYLALEPNMREAYEKFARDVPPSKGLPIYNRMAQILHWPILKTNENGSIIQDAGRC